MAHRGKKYLEAASKIEADRSYSASEAVDLAKQSSFARFDETVELHLRMGVDPRQADQQVRGTALLPYGLGKQVRVLVFAQGDGARMASEAGADYVGSDDLIQRIEGGWIDFDVAIATPDMMGRIGRLGRIIGRKGLMPNPKSGTVVPPADIPKAISEARMGRVEFKLDRTALIHLPLGKVSFENQKLMSNLSTLMDAIVKAKPSGVKGQFIKSAYLTTTMGPGIKLDLSSTMALQPE